MEDHRTKRAHGAGIDIALPRPGMIPSPHAPSMIDGVTGVKRGGELEADPSGRAVDTTARYSSHSSHHGFSDPGMSHRGSNARWAPYNHARPRGSSETPVGYQLGVNLSHRPGGAVESHARPRDMGDVERQRPGGGSAPRGPVGSSSSSVVELSPKAVEAVREGLHSRQQEGRPGHVAPSSKGGEINPERPRGVTLREHRRQAEFMRHRRQVCVLEEIRQGVLFDQAQHNIVVENFWRNAALQEKRHAFYLRQHEEAMGIEGDRHAVALREIEMNAEV